MVTMSTMEAVLREENERLLDENRRLQVRLLLHARCPDACGDTADASNARTRRHPASSSLSARPHLLPAVVSLVVQSTNTRLSATLDDKAARLPHLEEQVEHLQHKLGGEARAARVIVAVN